MHNQMCPICHKQEAAAPLVYCAECTSAVLLAYNRTRRTESKQVVTGAIPSQQEQQMAEVMA